MRMLYTTGRLISTHSAASGHTDGAAPTGGPAKCRGDRYVGENLGGARALGESGVYGSCQLSERAERKSLSIVSAVLVDADASLLSPLLVAGSEFHIPFGLSLPGNEHSVISPPRKEGAKDKMGVSIRLTFRSG